LKEKWKPPKVSLADIKNDLPSWPDGVISQWLFHLANRGDTGITVTVLDCNSRLILPISADERAAEGPKPAKKACGGDIGR
jgi:hypothetical protein